MSKRRPDLQIGDVVRFSKRGQHLRNRVPCPDLAMVVLKLLGPGSDGYTTVTVLASKPKGGMEKYNFDRKYLWRTGKNVASSISPNFIQSGKPMPPSLPKTSGIFPVTPQILSRFRSAYKGIPVVPLDIPVANSDTEQKDATCTCWNCGKNADIGKKCWWCEKLN